MTNVFPNVENRLEIRFLCQKRAGELPNGELPEVLNKLDLSPTCTYWDLKKSVWDFLNIEEPPEKIREERKSILERDITHSGGFPISQTEGSLLLKLFNLPEDTEDKKFLEIPLFEKITGSKSLR